MPEDDRKELVDTILGSIVMALLLIGAAYIPG